MPFIVPPKGLDCLLFFMFHRSHHFEAFARSQRGVFYKEGHECVYFLFLYFVSCSVFGRANSMATGSFGFSFTCSLPKSFVLHSCFAGYSPLACIAIHWTFVLFWYLSKWNNFVLKVHCRLLECFVARRASVEKSGSISKACSAKREVWGWFTRVAGAETTGPGKMTCVWSSVLQLSAMASCLASLN